MGLDVSQLDSALMTCRCVHAEDTIISTNVSMASQSEAKSIEKFLKPFQDLLRDEDEPNEGLKKVLQLFAKHRQ